MYDIYHWEAVPDKNFPKVNNVSQRVPHYEAYLKKYPFITIPGLVDDGSDDQKCVVSKLYKASYTTIVVVGMDGKIKYRKDHPSNFKDAYKGLDDILKSLLQTNIVPVTDAPQAPFRISHGRQGSMMHIALPTRRIYSFGIFDLSGKRIVLEKGRGFEGCTIPGLAASGAYIVRLDLDNTIYLSPVRVVR